MNIDASTKIYGLIGHPIKHSLSPIIHNTAFESIQLNCIYETFDVEPHNLKSAIDGIRALKIMGINVTIPHKENVLQYLDYISDEAKTIGAVNTIVNEKGCLKGYNTDMIGFVESLKEENEKIEGRDFIIIGAGGAARAVSTAAAINGAKSIIISNRSIDKAVNLSEYIKEKFHLNCTCCSLEELAKLEKIDILVNATNIGMYPYINNSPVCENIISKSNFIYDLIYNPEKTLFLKYAEKYGIKCTNGLNMLLNQANASFKIWTGKNFNKNLIKNIIIKKEFIK
ncbi:shikimate dehydrogenase [Aceticella autotrophica]|uniref:Shikimate dehydrogenase (NADP(+)) n=1 Tax=Aceticella autotrophica TaxID=2755338 RepID=A0A975AU86_9THEO|nr:shikimate dehydrogenase [Aceticella autotrophica]QSZ26535.1 shikimate dehydrogenase [Aceticella autotrophica]